MPTKSRRCFPKRFVKNLFVPIFLHTGKFNSIIFPYGSLTNFTNFHKLSFVYDSISIDTLGEMFDIEANIVHSQISKMIINEELMASLDEPTRTVVMHRTEPSRIQSLSLQLADKVNMLLDYNERLWELKQTPLGHFSQGGRFDRNYQNRGGNRQGNRGQGAHRGGGGGGNRQYGDRQQNRQNYRDRDQKNRRDHHHNRDNRQAQTARE